MTEISIHTGARLHFGLFSHGQTGRRQFGGVGMMIDRPGFRLRAAPAPVDTLACGPWTPRVALLLARIRAAHSVAPLRLEMAESPPAHSGLGSGTQLGMALARLVSLRAGKTGVDPADLARIAGRGLRSAIGLHGFHRGGLLVEAGHRADEISPLVARAEVPDAWRILLVRPRGGIGVSGANEVRDFARLDPMPLETTDRLCGIALTELVPAVIEGDYEAACAAIGEFGRLVGEYFNPVQGGVFADPRIRAIEPLLNRRNLKGYGQTSWGPTLFVLCPDSDFAQRLAGELAAHPEGTDCEFTIAAPLNQGAAIEYG